MNLLKAAEFKVGLLVIGISSLIAFMSMRVSNDPTLFSRSNEAWFQLQDAGGMVKGSAVKTSGIPVGVIKNISLQDGLARIDMTLRSDIKLYVSAAVTIKSQGILGDKYVEISPGNASDPPLPRGAQILNVNDKGSLDNVIASVGEIAGSLKETAKALQEAVTEDGTRKHILGRIVANIEKVTGDLAQMTGENKDKIGEIIDKVNNITSSLEDVLGDETPEGLKARLASTMKNVDEITTKINKGEGTIGKLINDEETVDGLNTAIEGVNGFLDTANKTQTGLDFHSEYLGNVGGARTTVAIRIQPGLDRFYYLGIVDDPAGVVDKSEQSVTSNGVTSETQTKTRFLNKTKFTAQFGKNFYDLTVRGGLIDSTGGLGLDYSFWRDRFKFTIEALEFSNLNLRSQLQYNFYRGMYLNVGVQDIFNKGSKYSNYLGAGLLLTNDDLKMLLTKVPL
jgi:phospholipid/cholesterol/gamma-HCH transport system substrate-binding protein